MIWVHFSTISICTIIAYKFNKNVLGEHASSLLGYQKVSPPLIQKHLLMPWLMYTFGHSLHGMLYITSETLSGGD